MLSRQARGSHVILKPLAPDNIKGLGFVSQIVRRYIKFDGEHGGGNVDKVHSEKAAMVDTGQLGPGLASSPLPSPTQGTDFLHAPGTWSLLH